MDGIVTILEEPYFEAVREIWQDLEQTCGLKEIQAMTIPHFSWHVAAAYPDEARLDALLEETCQQFKPFIVRTAGLGIFSHPKMVVYLPLVKTQALISLHQWLWDHLLDQADLPSPYYAPDFWMPHITLAYEELGAVNLDCVLLRLSTHPTNWEIKVDNLALIGQVNNVLHPACIQHKLSGNKI